MPRLSLYISEAVKGKIETLAAKNKISVSKLASSFLEQGLSEHGLLDKINRFEYRTNIVLAQLLGCVYDKAIIKQNKDAVYDYLLVAEERVNNEVFDEALEKGST